MPTVYYGPKSANSNVMVSPLIGSEQAPANHRSSDKPADGPYPHTARVHFPAI